MLHDRLSVLNALESQGVAPVFYHPDPEVCLNVIRAAAREGANDRGANAARVRAFIAALR